MYEGFNGFSRKTLSFLKGLGENNSKVWFEAHRQDYVAYLLEPFQRLVAEMSSFMLTIDPLFETRPAIDRTISRIYRDTRFSRDKSPFRPRMWLTFKRPSRDWKIAPAYFFEISPDRYRYGAGFYSAPKPTMDRLRQLIDDQDRQFLDVLSQYRQQDVFHIEGQQYKRIIDSDKPPEIQEWYQRKNLFIVCNRKIDDILLSRELVDDLISGFGLLAPLYHFLWTAVE
ncbi:MAG: DUF2461 domain-containing protein [Fidelibacterota bacterium]|nr:MAG: DUF2461 domain-containing protein [Candidatus Neomarinimicrobiota bacterium]